MTTALLPNFKDQGIAVLDRLAVALGGLYPTSQVELQGGHDDVERVLHLLVVALSQPVEAQLFVLLHYVRRPSVGHVSDLLFVEHVNHADASTRPREYRLTLMEGGDKELLSLFRVFGAE